MSTTTEDAATTEYGRTTSRWSRMLFMVVAAALVGGIGLAVVDMVGESDHKVAVVQGGVAAATTRTRDFGYVPALIESAQGVPLRVTIHNQGIHEHTFTIDSLGTDVVIPPRTTRVVTLTLPRSGQYLFYCRFHQAFGMRGHVEVRR